MLGHGRFRSRNDGGGEGRPILGMLVGGRACALFAPGGFPSCFPRPPPAVESNAVPLGRGAGGMEDGGLSALGGCAAIEWTGTAPKDGGAPAGRAACWMFNGGRGGSRVLVGCRRRSGGRWWSRAVDLDVALPHAGTPSTIARPSWHVTAPMPSRNTKAGSVVIPNNPARCSPRAPKASMWGMAVHGIVENRRSVAPFVRHRDTRTTSNGDPSAADFRF